MQRKTTKRAIARSMAPLPEGAQAFVDQMMRVAYFSCQNWRPERCSAQWPSLSG